MRRTLQRFDETGVTNASGSFGRLTASLADHAVARKPVEPAPTIRGIRF